MSFFKFNLSTQKFEEFFILNFLKSSTILYSHKKQNYFICYYDKDEQIYSNQKPAVILFFMNKLRLYKAITYSFIIVIVGN